MKKREKYLFINQDNNTYIISLTPELQDDIGTVGYVDFETENGQVAKDDTVATLEASKTVFEIAAPLSGTITEVNQALKDKPELLNSEDTNENWLFKMKDVDEETFNGFEDAE